MLNEAEVNDPSTDDQEYVEIKNVSGITLDLANYSLRHIDGNGGVTLWWVQLAGTLAAGDWIVGCINPANIPACDVDLKTLNGVGGGSPPTGTTGMLDNGSDALGIYDGGNMPGSIVDGVAYGGGSCDPDVAAFCEGGNPAPVDPATAGRVIGRWPDGNDTNNNGADWIEQDATTGFSNSPTTPTPTASATGTSTSTATPSASSTPTSTPVPTDTPTSTPVPTGTPTSTPAPSDTPTSTPAPTGTPTSTPAPTDTLTSTPAPTGTPTSTPAPTDTPTSTPVPTDIPTSTPAPTDTPTCTPVPTGIPTNTPVPTDTPESTVTPTHTATTTPAPTNTPTATFTTTPDAPHTPDVPSTPLPTLTSTPTPSITPTPGAIARGDCNHDDAVDAGDMSAIVLEIFDDDGSSPPNAPNGTFIGDPIGCNANGDAQIDAGDITCTALKIFNGNQVCGP